MSLATFGSLASLRDRPVPEQAGLRTLKNGYRDHPIDHNAVEASEPLVDLLELGFHGLNYYASGRNPPHYHPIPGSVPNLWVRAGVAARLSRVEERLPEVGLCLWLFDAWRPTKVQAYFHDHWMPRALRERYPDLDRDCLHRRVSQYWAAPTAQGESPSPHLTGAAVDLAICWTDTLELLWFGSIFDDVGELAHRDRFEKLTSPGIALSDDEARANRRLLYWLMLEAGFCGHPDEWWHFSFGDQMWARLTGTPNAVYSAADPPP